MNDHFYLKEKSKLLSNDNLTDKSKAALIMSKSENTIDAYESDWQDFSDWCKYNNQNAFPPTAETIVNYINDLATYAKANTISRRISAISENLNASAINFNPCTSPLVKSALKGIRRMKGTFQEGKTPILLMDLDEIFTEMDKLENLNPLVKARDKAILLIGFLGAFRRSELSKIEYEHLRFVSEGLEIFIPSSKADQLGQGDIVAIPFIEDVRFCGIKALRYWLKLSNIKTGPIFRAFKKNMEVRSAAISDKSIAEIVKKYIELIDLDPIMYGAHSLRHGFATTAANFGVEERDIMRQTRHHSVNMVRRYINEANRFNHNPISTIFNQLKLR